RALTPSKIYTREETELLLKDDAKLLRAELRLRRKELKDAKEREVFDSAVEILLAIIRQPATGLVLGIVVCELLERAGIFSAWLASVVEGVLLVGGTVTALGNAVPAFSGLKGLLR
ncbi:unnamed protein product, partial [marine sediment metagenome]